jgi:hypothetical protein
MILILAMVGCLQKPHPIGVSRPPPQQPVAPAPPPGEQPPASANPDVPIDPATQMPQESLSTRAQLELARPTLAVIDGRADIYSSGLPAADPNRGGRLPALLGLVPGGGYITFNQVKGVVGCMAGQTTPPDGGNCAGGDTNIRPANGISGIVNHGHSQFLVGVFLTADVSRKAPPTLDFSSNAKGEAFPELAPQIGQTFFIGDGFTPTGLQQRFIIPTGATRLYLAFADAFSFQGDPGSYEDNTGGLHATVMQQQ